MQEKILIWLLRLAGVCLLPAFLAMVMPTDWMAATHRWLGLGEFPASSLTDYLTRSIAALYGFHGVLLLVVSTDVRRYRGIVGLLAVMNLLFGVMISVIDVHAGIPLWWTLAEGPPVIGFGLALAWLRRSVPPC